MAIESRWLAVDVAALRAGRLCLCCSHSSSLSAHGVSLARVCRESCGRDLRHGVADGDWDTGEGGLALQGRGQFGMKLELVVGVRWTGRTQLQAAAEASHTTKISTTVLGLCNADTICVLEWGTKGKYCKA